MSINHHLYGGLLHSLVIGEYRPRAYAAERMGLGYLVKDHPLLFSAVEAYEYLPMKFIVVHRNVLSVVASTLKHEGALSWVLRAQELPKNGLSGTLHATKEEHAALPIEGQATLKWIDHIITVERVVNALPEEDVLLVDYDELAGKKKSEEALEEFIGAKVDEEIIRHSRGHGLSTQQIDTIIGTVNDYYKDFTDLDFNF